MDIVGTPGDDTLNGTLAADVIRGGAGNDSLDGLDGNDQLWGGLGADLLKGGAGRDVAVYLTSASGVTVNLADTGPQSGGDAEGDRLSGIEDLTGSHFNDVLTGDAGANIFRGAEGADIIDGGDGRDRASYAYSSAAVDIDLTRTGAQSGGDAAGDVLIRIENVTGSDHDDRITGDTGNNEISGGAGADIIDGGLGSDTVDYRGSTAVDVDLTRAVQIGGHAAGDQLSNIENLTGTSYADRLIGDGNANYISGDAGNDYIDGGTGFDYLSGGAGNDTVVAHVGTIAYGGAGTDTLVLQLDSPSTYYGYNVGLANGGILVDYNPSDFYFRAEGIQAFEFERVEVHGSVGNDNFSGTTGADILLGNAGDDSITGGQGRDYLDGGDGFDRLFINYGSANTRDITVDLPAGKAYGYEAALNFEYATITTGSGKDHITGLNGTNEINSGGGDDTIDLSHSFGWSYVDTGIGVDHFLGGSSRDDVTAHGTGQFDGGGGEDRLILTFTGLGDVTLDLHVQTSGLSIVNFEDVEIYREDADAGNDVFLGHDGYNYIASGGGNDLVDGRGGDDDLHGGAGNDTLLGGAGNDGLNGGAGDNVLTGGDGDDVFTLFLRAHDTITDFNHDAGDVIHIARYPWDAELSFDQLMGLTQDTAEGALMTFAPDRSLLLADVLKDSLSAADFA